MWATLLDRASELSESHVTIYKTASEGPAMSTGRGILTGYEKDCLAGKTEKQREYEARSRVRARIDGPLQDDIEHLREHDPDLLAELRKVVCEVD